MVVGAYEAAGLGVITAAVSADIRTVCRAVLLFLVCDLVVLIFVRYHQCLMLFARISNALRLFLTCFED